MQGQGGLPDGRLRRGPWEASGRHHQRGNDEEAFHGAENAPTPAVEAGMEANNEALYIRRDTVTEQRHPEQQSAEQGKPRDGGAERDVSGRRLRQG